MCVMTFSKMVAPCHKMAAETKWWKGVECRDHVTRGLEDTSGASGISGCWKGPKVGDQVRVFTYLELILFS